MAQTAIATSSVRVSQNVKRKVTLVGPPITKTIKGAIAQSRHRRTRGVVIRKSYVECAMSITWMAGEAIFAIQRGLSVMHVAETAIARRCAMISQSVMSQEIFASPRSMKAIGGAIARSIRLQSHGVVVRRRHATLEQI